jgi:SecD/SecF fusion protein
VFDGMAPEVKTISNNYTVEVKTKFLYNSQDADANDVVDAKLEEGLKAFGEFRILDQRQVDSSVSSSLMTSSILAIVFSLIIIFAYIAFRFRKWQFGLGALAAMFHDVIIVLSLFSIFWGILPFSLEIDQAFIAAILTVVGYSINDTVIVFDRIREYLDEHRKSGRKDVINYALNSTLSRTINTSMTTFMVLLIIFLFGGESIKGFSFALMVGVVVGTYSSLFIASPLVVDLTKDEADAKK